jgi:GNAT superfamily N-acetyltransferase
MTPLFSDSEGEMRDELKAVPLQEKDKNRFLDFLGKDEVRHIFTIYDLKHMSDKTRIWVATKEGQTVGYVFEFDKRIVHTHGTVESVNRLLPYIRLDELTFVIEPNHLTLIERFFEPLEPTDAASKGKITKYFVMKVEARRFKPIIRHKVKKLGQDDLKEVLTNFGEEWKKRVRDALERGIAYSAYDDDVPAAMATVTETTDRIAFIRGVHTLPLFRGKGLATSAVSALVKDALRQKREPVLWVAEDNLPARRVYKKIGFKETRHVLFGFKARRRLNQVS